MAGPSRKQLFGEIAVSQGLLTDAQLTEALRVQGDLKGRGVKKTLGAVCHDLGYLSLVQTNAIMEEVTQERRRGSIEGYKILSKLGKGGMGSVYLARQLSLDKLVAIKILPPRLAQNDEDLARFQREAMATAKLNHPNIVHAFDVGESNGYNYLVMEYVEGETVRDLLEKQGTFDEAHALDILERLADALRHAWQQGIVHRDIKPSNIVITRDGTPKLLDLGLAISKKDDASITKTGVIMGTPYYLSPEQARSEETDTRSDIYSMGVTLYHMLVGEPPFVADSAAVIVSKHLLEPLPDPLEKNPGLSNGICFVLSKMTAKDAADRYQTPDELLTDIRELKHLSYVRSKGGVLPDTALAAAVEGRTRRRGQGLLARAGTILLAAGIPSALLVGITALEPEVWGRAWDRLRGRGTGLTIGDIAARANEAAEREAERQLSEAEHYAEQNPSDVDGMRDRFAMIARQMGTASTIKRRAEARVQMLDLRVHQEAQKVFDGLLREAMALRAEGKFDEARVTLRRFPTRFARTPWWSMHEREIQQVDAAEAADRARKREGEAGPSSGEK